MTNSQKKVLLLSYLFPPIGGIGVQRPLKFVKYLRDFGIEPVVLTTDRAYYPTMDESLVNQIPEGVTVHRLADPISRWIGRFVATTSKPTTETRVVEPDERPFRDWVVSLLKNVKKMLFIPDERIYWAIRAAGVGRRLIESLKIDCIYTTSGPNSTHIAGWLIHQMTGIKWVADFRDPWTDNLHFTHTGIRARFERWMERQVFRQAEAITVVTQGFQDLFTAKYPKYAHKISVIRNGFDPLDVSHDNSATKVTKRRTKPFTFFYSGILYEKRSPEPFLQALSSLLRYGLLNRRDIVVQFAGIFDYPGQTANADLADTLGLKDVVEVLGHLPHGEVLQRQRSADVLLLIGEKSRLAGQYVPGKLYEYFYARRPILALIEEGEAADLIREVQSGTVVSPYKTKCIEEEILRLVKQGDDGGFQPNESTLSSFTRKSQTGQLAEIVYRLTDGREMSENSTMPFQGVDVVGDL